MSGFAHFRNAVVNMFAAAALFTGCSNHAPEPSVPVGDSKGAFAFDARHTISLTIAKADPATGDRWLARLVRKTESPGMFYENDPWIVENYSESTSLSDRLANRNYLLHLIDTLSTFHATAATGQRASDPQARGAAGLNPPRYALKWEVREPESKTSKTFEAEIGNPVDPKNPQSKESFGTFLPDTRILRVDGAALAMLDYLKSFETLRLQTLSPVASDDIDEIEISHGKKRVFYAQREGDRWTNEQHRAWKKDVGAFLERITHLRIQKFVDSDADSAAKRAFLEKNLLETLTLKDRSGNATTFLFAREKKEALAAVSTRGNAVFELYPEALKRLEP